MNVIFFIKKGLTKKFSCGIEWVSWKREEGGNEEAN